MKAFKKAYLSSLLCFGIAMTVNVLPTNEAFVGAILFVLLGIGLMGFGLAGHIGTPRMRHWIEKNY
jgi:uncharacterized membrane protein YczE